jgi:branched-chain amino acid transport system ATP-binding protein
MILNIRNIAKRFGGLSALGDVSFSVAEGEVLGLMGANGAGKTTLFDLISGTEVPDDGIIQLCGKRIDGLPAETINRLGIARTYQVVRPFPAMTVRENVALGVLFGSRQERSRAKAESYATDVIAEVGLEAQSDVLARHLTLAARKRLEVARAIATEPKLLLLDEVLAGLTPTEVNEALELIHGVHQRRRLTIIVIEHVIHALKQLCSRAIVLDHGRKIAEGSLQEIASDPEVIDAYLGVEV